MFGGEFSTVTFTREGTILPNWTYLVQRISSRSALDNIELKDTLFTPNIEEFCSETPSHEPIVAPENNNKTLTLPQYKPHVKYSPVIEGVSAYKVHEHTYSEVFQNTSNLNKVFVTQQSSNATSMMPYHGVNRVQRYQKYSKKNDLASTGIRKSAKC